ncbi:Rne/Rng family ribonuclease [Deferrisoma camini]|uniref:Rne/Rng family ribonuclease n=1 Tax=Deferrisoma camini TaxID=1035120 RepID=UPI00046CEB04|nr:Rne/Rng family ribonuclease [Deferrisoma camini]
MSKVMLVNVVNEEESRIAIVADGLLEEVAIETAQVERLEGNIYKARVVKVVPSLDAVFVDFGAEKNGFLPVEDIHPRYFPEGKRSTSAVKTGQELLVQVRKGEMGQKGAALTTYISLPGRYFVLMPYVAKRGVSKKIEDEATRKQLRDALDAAQIPEEMGYIVRTAAEGRTKQELTRDANYLLRLWKRILRDAEDAPAPSLLYQDSDIVIRTIRDYFTPGVEEVWIDNPEVFEQVRRFFQAVMPWYTRRVKLHQRRTPIFARYNVEQQLATIYEKSVPLPSGGSIVIEQTEALVSIDVNSGGSFQGKDIEETALRVNEEAAREAARQLRLRDLGGLIVIDFIDMRSSANRSAVRRALQKALKEDKARTRVGSISQFGLLELSRQRLKPGAAAAVTRPCPSCRGSGRVRSPESFALSVLRMIQAELPRKELRQVRVGVPADVAALIVNRKRRRLADWEREFETSVQVFSEPHLGPNDYFFVFVENGTPRIETNTTDVPHDLVAAYQGIPEPPTRVQRAPAYILMDEEPEEEEEPPAPEPEETDAQPPAKKKRRRRRRKKKSAPAEAAAGEQPAEGSGSTPEGDGQPEEKDPEQKAGEPSSDAEAGSEEAEPQPPAKKKRRRRRRKKKSAPAEAEAAPPAQPTEAAASAGEPAPGPAPAGEPPAAETPPPAEEPEEKPKPKRRRAREKPQEASQETAQEPASADAPPSETGTPAETEGTEGPKPKRRRTRKRAPAQAQETAPAEPAAASDETEASEGERPKRRATRKSRPEPAQEEVAQAGTPPAENAAPDEAGEEKEPKPRRRSSRKKTAEAPPADGTGQPAPKESGGEEPPKPKRRRTRKKTPEPSTGPADADTNAGGDPAEGSGEGGSGGGA